MPIASFIHSHYTYNKNYQYTGWYKLEGLMESFHTKIYIEPVGILLLSELEPGTDGHVDNLALLLQESLFVSII